MVLYRIELRTREQKLWAVVLWVGDDDDDDDDDAAEAALALVFCCAVLRCAVLSGMAHEFVERRENCR